MSELLNLLSMLKLEPYIMLIIFVYYLKMTPLDLLQQDKLCRHKYNMSDDFCYKLSSITEDDDDYRFKSLILSDTVNYKMYSYLITFIPGVIWSLFLGSWTDRYPKARKVIMLVGASTQAIENLMNAFNSYYFTTNINWILVSFIPYTLSGSMAISTCYAYVAATTPDEYKTMRMTIVEILIAITQPTATILSGVVIDNDPIFGNGQIHNYCVLFLICTSAASLAFVWALVMVDEENDKKQFLLKFGVFNHPKNVSDQLDRTEDQKKHPLRLLFDFGNIKQMVITYVKKRPNKVRSQILMVTLALFCNMFVIFGPPTFLFQFTENIYDWDATTYSYVYSFGQIGNSLVIMFISPILIKYFKLRDMTITIIGFIGLFVQNLIRGVILSPLGFYISIGTSCTTSLGAVGFRSHISKIVDTSEVGRVFTLMTVIDAVAPIIASSLLAKLFAATMDSIPGTCFLILAFISLISIIMAMLIDIMNLKIKKKLDNEVEIDKIGQSTN